MFSADLPRQRPSCLQQLAGRVQAAQQAALQTLLGGEETACHRPLQRAADPGDPRQKPAGAGLWDDPAAREHEADARVLGGQADIHWQGHRRPDPHRRTIDGGEDRLGGLPHPQHHLPAVVPRDLSVVALLRTAGRPALGAARAPRAPSALSAVLRPRLDQRAAASRERLPAGRQVRAGAESPSGAGDE